MLYSMTGFGRGRSIAADGSEITIEISSVNRKQLEVRFNLPRTLMQLESELRKLIGSRVSRGSLYCHVHYLRSASSNAPVINLNYLQQLTAVCLETSPGHPVDVATLLSLPGVLETTESAEDETLKDTVFEAMKLALDNFCAMRKSEGENLKIDLLNHLNIIEDLYQKVQPLAQGVNAQIKQKLLSRIQESGISVDLNDERMLKELLFYADKSDVTEELTRLNSHFDQFRTFLTPEIQDAGRSLDFLMQEMFREITTLGNKSGSGAMSPLVVKFKTELEKMREQIQNLE